MPMRLQLIPLIVLTASACGPTGPFPRIPDTALIEEIEAKLQTVPCVGPMSRWERHYTFSSKPSLMATLLSFGANHRWFHYQTIDIAYYQAGFEEFRAGRVVGRSEPPGADDRQYNLVFGHYDIPSHTAYLWACGPNMSQHIPVDENIVVR
jgi:hypothetical protein